MIAYWLNRLGLIYDFRLEEIAKETNLYRAMVKTSYGGPSTSLIDVGFACPRFFRHWCFSTMSRNAQQ